jgi:hypothetical protein
MTIRNRRTHRRLLTEEIHSQFDRAAATGPFPRQTNQLQL